MKQHLLGNFMGNIWCKINAIEVPQYAYESIVIEKLVALSREIFLGQQWNNSKEHVNGPI